MLAARRAEMKPNSFKKNIIYAFGAQFASLFLSVAMTLLIPKALGVEKYAYWQLYLFYISYTGFAHFGICDGVYLRIGGQDYGRIDRPLLKSQLVLLSGMQSVLAVLIVLSTLAFSTEPDRVVVLAATSVYMVLFNVSGYLGFIFQATNNTQVYSKSVLIDKLTFLVAVLFLLFVGVERYLEFILFHLFCKAVSAGYLFWKARDIVASGLADARETVHQAWINATVGIKLLIANIASQLILGCGRLVIDGIWGIEAFGKLSFSLSLANFFLQFISQVSMVLFPALRRVSKEQQRELYMIMRNALSLVMPCAYLFYLPAKLFIEFWLPNYAQSIQYLALLLPICVFDAKMQMLCNTYMKVMREEKYLLRINLLSVCVSAALCLLSGLGLHSINMIAISMAVAVAFRSILAEVNLARKFSYNTTKQLFFETGLTVLFVTMNILLEPIYAFVVYLVAYIVYIILRRKDAKHLFWFMKQRKVGEITNTR